MQYFAQTYHLKGGKVDVHESVSLRKTAIGETIHYLKYSEEVLIPEFTTDDPKHPTIIFDTKTFRSGEDLVVGKYSNFTNDEINDIQRMVGEYQAEGQVKNEVLYGQISTKFKDFVQSISLHDTPPVDIRALKYPPNLPTATAKFDELTLTGLHLDRMDPRFPNEEDILKRRQRITLNISSEPRIFMFGDLPSTKNKDFHASGQLEETLVNMDNITDVGTIRYIYLPTFSFCIAPTENVFHDASTICCDLPAIALTALFDPDFDKLAS